MQKNQIMSDCCSKNNVAKPSVVDKCCCCNDDITVENKTKVTATEKMQKSESTAKTNAQDDCCSGEISGEGDDDPDSCDCCAARPKPKNVYFPIIISTILLFGGLLFEHFCADNIYFSNNLILFNLIKIVVYITAFLPVGISVCKTAWNLIKQGDYFTEFSLMATASIGAICIGQYPEGVTVMLFYTIGEILQNKAVKRSKANIKALLDIRSNYAWVKQGSDLTNNNFIKIDAKKVKIGSLVEVKVGEKIPLDGILLSDVANLNTAALTGESTPKRYYKGENIMAGSINLDKVIQLKVNKSFDQSSITKILDLIQHATNKKSKTELLMRKLAKVYTPIIAMSALLIIVLPIFFVSDYQFKSWLYRALVFLVLSCPCALVISIPLGYFGGLGAASRKGLLFKGALYLDQISKVKTMVFDKTGTLTKAVFNIQKIVVKNISKNNFLQILKAVESKSNHPIAQAACSYADKNINENLSIEVISNQEIAGKGLLAQVKINHKVSQILIGNLKLMQQFSVKTEAEVENIIETSFIMAIDGAYCGYVIIADELKDNVVFAMQKLRQNGVDQLIMLSGDKNSIAQKTAKKLGFDQAFAELLPADKMYYLQQIMTKNKYKTAFIGDGINDSPSLALSDIGIAMGGLGSDLAIESADIIVQSDDLTKIATAIKIAKSTKYIIWQNIFIAFGVKALILTLGAFGLANMWEAVFADVGVALIAISNAIRLQKMHWD